MVSGKKSATLLKVTLLHVCFSSFLNCTNGTKSRNVSDICQLEDELSSIKFTSIIL